MIRSLHLEAFLVRLIEFRCRVEFSIDPGALAIAVIGSIGNALQYGCQCLTPALTQFDRVGELNHRGLVHSILVALEQLYLHVTNDGEVFKLPCQLLCAAWSIQTTRKSHGPYHQRFWLQFAQCCLDWRELLSALE